MDTENERLQDTLKRDESLLPASVRSVAVDDKTVYLIGTAHVSRQSVEDVRRTVAAVHPDSICVELCPARHKAIVQRDAWKQMNIFKVIREKKAVFLLAQLIMTAFYRKIGEQLGVEPGAEMVEGVRQAERLGATLVLADRDIDVTLKRVWGHLGLWHRLKLLFHLLTALFVGADVDGDAIEELKDRDQLENVLKSFSEAFPEIKHRLLDERDIYLAQKIREAPGQVIAAVVGAAHVPGIERAIGEMHRLEPLREVPPKSPVGAALKWILPGIIVALLFAGFVRDGAQHSVSSIQIWFVVNGTLSALGAAIALAHPLTILSAFLGAPLTSLNPMIAAGWVAGLVQAWVKKPTVQDLEELPKAVVTVKGFWMNPVSRILLVVVLANVGSSLGTFIAGVWIARRTFPG